MNAVLNITIIYHNYWIYVLTLIGAIGYVAFWAIQFYGCNAVGSIQTTFLKNIATRIDSRQILMKITDEQGGCYQMGYDQNC